MGPPAVRPSSQRVGCNGRGSRALRLPRSVTAGCFVRTRTSNLLDGTPTAPRSVQQGAASTAATDTARQPSCDTRVQHGTAQQEGAGSGAVIELLHRLDQEAACAAAAVRPHVWVRGRRRCPPAQPSAEDAMRRAKLHSPLRTCRAAGVLNLESGLSAPSSRHNAVQRS